MCMHYKILHLTGAGNHVLSLTRKLLSCMNIGQGEERTSEITGIQKTHYPSAGIPLDLSDNSRGRKEYAGCRSEPGGKERQDRVIWEIYLSDVCVRGGEVTSQKGVCTSGPPPRHMLPEHTHTYMQKDWPFHIGCSLSSN